MRAKSENKFYFDIPQEKKILPKFDKLGEKVKLLIKKN
jgi:hypothetical protein